MRHKMILTLAIAFFCQAGFADKCPTVNDIKTNNLAGWKAYDSEDHTPLSAERMAIVQKYAQQFVLAEWPDSQQKEGVIRCYYRDKEGSDLQAYLSKTSFAPTNPKKNWYQVTGSTDCAADINKCQFHALPASAPQHQLAANSSATG